MDLAKPHRQRETSPPGTYRERQRRFSASRAFRRTMSKAFDPYREALVVEQVTHWPRAVREATADWTESQREQLAAHLHSVPAEAVGLEYVRVHTGFCRRITVTPEDLQRHAGAQQ